MPRANSWNVCLNEQNEQIFAFFEQIKSVIYNGVLAFPRSKTADPQKTPSQEPQDLDLATAVALRDGGYLLALRGNGRNSWGENAPYLWTGVVVVLLVVEVPVSVCVFFGGGNLRCCFFVCWEGWLHPIKRWALFELETKVFFLQVLLQCTS